MNNFSDSPTLLPIDRSSPPILSGSIQQSNTPENNIQVYQFSVDDWFLEPVSGDYRIILGTVTTVDCIIQASAIDGGGVNFSPNVKILINSSNELQLDAPNPFNGRVVILR